MSFRSAQTSTRSPVSVACSQLIGYSFSWLLCVSLCHAPHAPRLSVRALSPYACVTAVRHLLFRIFSLSALTLSAAVCIAQFLIREFCSSCVWTSPWTDHHQPWAVMDSKKDFKAGSWVTWHIHSVFWDFGASGGFGFLSDQSRGSCLICGGSVVEQVLRWSDSRLNHSSLKSIQPFCVWYLISWDLQ